jgi:putative flippase GtrA/acetyl esterase/lipase
VTVIATTAGLPLLDALVRLSTRSPRVDDVELGGLPATVYRPPGAGPWPAAIVLNGATPLGNRHRAVQRLGCGLARAGLVAVLPELPGLEEGEVDARTGEATVAVAGAVACRDDVRDGRVALLGVSTGAGLALLAASDDRLRGRVSVVAAVAPFADLRLVLRLATTGFYERGGLLQPYRTDPLLRRVVARSLAAALPNQRDRELLLSALPPSGEDAESLPSLPAEALDGLGPEGRAVADVLANRDPRRFDALFEELPAAVHALVEQLSPARRALDVDAPVELVTAPDDGYFPLAEAELLAARIPGSRLTVTSALRHVRLRPTLRGARDLGALGAATVRCLRAASSRPRVGGARPAADTVRRASSRLVEPSRFVTVGVAGYAVNLGLFSLALAAGTAYGAAAVTSYLLSNALMYLGNRYFTFRLGHDGFLAGYLRYLLVGVLVVALDVALLASLVDGAGLDPLVGNALALLAVTPVAFGANKRWTFQPAAG